MLQEFEDWAEWYAILAAVKDHLLPPVMLELLEEVKCQYSSRDLRRLLGARNRKACQTALASLPEDTRIDELAQWLWHTNMTFLLLTMDAIERAIEAADYIGDDAPRPPSALEVLRICVRETWQNDTYRGLYSDA